MDVYKCHYCQSKKLNKTCRNLNFYECSDCGLYARYPMPSESELNSIYSECYSEENITSNITNQLSPVDLYESLGNFINQNFFTEKKVIKILDYGSGTGGLLKELKHYGNSSNDVLEGIEYSKSARVEANKNFGDDVFHKTIPNKKYQLITMIEVIEHLTQPWIDLDLILSHMEKNGELLITTPNLGGLNALLTGCNWREQNKPFHLIMFKKKFLGKLLYDAGFQHVRFVKFFPVSADIPFQKVKTKILQLFGLHGGICVVAKK
jgi:2-polyprenyl-3-methyl-5-hydroxy-6-metoxy-1,4-benzoquinol methylase